MSWRPTIKIPKEKMFMKTEITTDGACPGNADIEGVLKELAAIRADMVAAPAMSYPRDSERTWGFMPPRPAPAMILRATTRCICSTRR